MSQFKIVITDFGSPDSDPEQAVLSASGLDYNLIRLNNATPYMLIPQFHDAAAFLAQNVVDALQGKAPYPVVNRKELGWTT